MNRVIELKERHIQRKLPNSLAIMNDFGRLILPTSEGSYIIPFHEIRYCSSDSNYCRVYTIHDQEIMVSKTLKSIEKILPKASFIRTHQSYLINLKYLRFVSSEYILLDNKFRIPVSRSKKQYIRSLIKS